MNYVGNISIMDRGDAPAQAVLDRNARSLAKRVADETKEELGKVMNRVDNIYGNFELGQSLLENNHNIEYANDMAELESLLTDQVKKKKYQQQVTIFIVGYENVCGQKLKLLQQVNEFFMDNSNKFEDDETQVASPDIDLDEMNETIEDTLKTTEDLAMRLGELNKEMVGYMQEYAAAKASNKGKKKLERALATAKDDLLGVSEKLMNLQTEKEELEDKIQQMFKQIEMKNMEAQRYKTAAEVAKRGSEESESMREILAAKDAQLKELRHEIDRLQIDLGSTEHSQENKEKRLQAMQNESSGKLESIQKDMEDMKISSEEAKRDDDEENFTGEDKKELLRYHNQQVEDLNKSHLDELEQLKAHHVDEIKKLLEEIERLKDRLDKQEEAEAIAEQAKIDAIKRAESAEAAKKRVGELENQDGERSRPATKETKKKPGSKQGPKPNVSITEPPADEQVEAPNDSKPPTRSKSKSSLEPVTEIQDFGDSFDLKDEESWSQQPPQHALGRFLQYRKLTKKKLDELENTLDSTVSKTTRKINTIKAQFIDHKKKWEMEREVLVQQVEQAQDLHVEAEKEADNAIAHLEDFINEQEELEKDEEDKRMAMDNGAKDASMDLAQAEAQLKETLERHQQDDDEDKERLLSQTDDAKAALSGKNSKLTGHTSTEEEDQNMSPEDIHRASAMSRASVRETHKAALNSLKASAEERRAKSPTLMSVRSQKSVLSDAELDENGDMPFPPDETKEQREKREELEKKIAMRDVGTSPMFFKDRTASSLYSRKTIPMAEHPVVIEFLKIYDGLLTFKDNLSKVFFDKDMMSMGQVLSEIEAMEFNKDEKVQPQIEEMSNLILSVLDESYQTVVSVIANERDYPVSSLYNVSRDPTRSVFTREKSMDSVKTKSVKTPSAKSTASSTTGHLQELQRQYSELQRKYELGNKKYQDQLNHNTVVMMEMQDTINALQRELTIQGKQPDNIDADGRVSTPIMFTRLDSERNAKVMKKALNEHRLSEDNYKTAVDTMDSYVDIPAKRLARLAAKYTHHVKMKEIEEQVRRSKSLDDKVFDVLERMEALQNDRAQRWADQMDTLADERMRLANELMMLLDQIERESGIFLIKPMFSYRSVYPVDVKNKLSRAIKPSRDNTALEIGPVNVHTLLPTTPASNVRPVQRTQSNPDMRGKEPQLEAHLPQDPEDGLSGKSNLPGDYPRPVWNQNTSTTSNLPDQAFFNPYGHLNTPRILELDINRMLIGQNQVSTKVLPNYSSSDRLANAANQSTRAYVTVNRPAGSTQKSKDNRPNTHGGIQSEHSAPPTTPMKPDYSSPSNSAKAGGIKRVTMSGDGVARSFPVTPPLPPITPRQNSEEPPLPPASPPGSSLRQSPPPTNIPMTPTNE